jgi:hypothetical protein
LDRSSPTPPGRDPQRPVSDRLADVARRLVPTGPAAIPSLAMSTGQGGGFRPGGQRPAAGTRPAGRPGGSGAGVGGPRLPGGGAPAPRPQRYWTDYLRILLPVVGLILMLSVFIFWVDNIISGDDDGTATEPPVALATSTTDPNAAAPSPTVAVQAPTTAPTEQPTASDNATEGEPTEAASDEGGEAPTEEATEATEEDPAPTEATGEEAAGDGFAAGDAVVTTEGGLNLREEPSTSGASLGTLEQGTALTIVSGPETGDDIEWYEVETEDGETGWVAAEFISAAEG